MIPREISPALVCSWCRRSDPRYQPVAEFRCSQTGISISDSLLCKQAFRVDVYTIYHCVLLKWSHQTPLGSPRSFWLIGQSSVPFMESSLIRVAQILKITPLETLSVHTRPPPTPPLCFVPAIPSATILAQRIINSANKLFFISKTIEFGIREWHLVRVAFSASTSSYPSCLEDGKYIVDFYSSHPVDFCLNVIN